MTRPLRIEFPGAVHHVTARGNGRRRIVLDDADRAAWTATLARSVARWVWICHAWCLMDNHFHLLVETPRPNLSRGMRDLNSRYAQTFNKRHGRSGHLFGGRYKAILVERETHLLEVCRYVVLNPMRSRTPPATLESFRWSSYPATAGLTEPPIFLQVDSILSHFGNNRSRAQARYRRFIHDAERVDLWRLLRGGLYLGSEQFVRKRHPRDLRVTDVPRAQAEPIRQPLERLLATETDRAILVAYRQHGYRLREIAACLGVHHSTVSRRLNGLERLERG